MLDEAHERTVQTDVLFALLKDLAIGEGRKRRPKNRPLKLVVMSATLDADAFSRYFGGAPVLYVAGRQHRVDVWYTERQVEDYVDAALATVLQVHGDAGREAGDMLVFLTGQDECGPRVLIG